MSSNNHTLRENIQKIKLLIETIEKFTTTRPLYDIDRHRFENLKQMSRECKLALREIEENL